MHSLRRNFEHKVESLAHSSRRAAPYVPRRARKMLGVDESTLTKDGAFRRDANVRAVAPTSPLLRCVASVPSLSF